MTTFDRMRELILMHDFDDPDVVFCADVLPVIREWAEEGAPVGDSGMGGNVGAEGGVLSAWRVTGGRWKFGDEVSEFRVADEILADVYMDEPVERDNGWDIYDSDENILDGGPEYGIEGIMKADAAIVRAVERGDIEGALGWATKRSV